MASSPSDCLIHINGESGPLTNFTEVSFKKFLDCRAIWLTLDGIQRDIAEKKRQKLHVIIALLSQVYHTIEVVILHLQIKRLYNEPKNVCVKSMKIKPKKRLLIQKRALRSSTVDFLTEENIAKRRSVHVLPAICIICKNKTSYVTERVGISKIYACM